MNKPIETIKSRSSTCRRSGAGSARRSTMPSCASSITAPTSSGPRSSSSKRSSRRSAARSRCVSCANGTDALAARADGDAASEPGDAVICPSFTFAATAEVVAWSGATPVLRRRAARTRSTWTPQASSRDLAEAKRQGLKPVGVIPVDLFGQPADYDDDRGRLRTRTASGSCATPPRASARPTRAARSARSAWRRRRASSRRSRSAATATAARSSPTTTQLAAVIRSLRVHGAGHRQVRQRPHRHERPARHDAGGGPDREAEDLSRRDRSARRNRGAVHRGPRRASAITPVVAAGSTSVWAQYTIRISRPRTTSRRS